MSDGGKGDKPRPFSVTQEEYDNRWNMIFQRDNKTEAEKFDVGVQFPGGMPNMRVRCLWIHTSLPNLSSRIVTDYPLQNLESDVYYETYRHR
jgi:hypothetical protein